MDKIDRIREVLDLKEYYKKKKRDFWIWVFRVIGSIALIAAAIYYWIYYV